MFPNEKQKLQLNLIMDILDYMHTTGLFLLNLSLVDLTYLFMYNLENTVLNSI